MIISLLACLDPEIIERLEKAGVEVLFFRHWIHRTHRKLIIIDNKKSLIGGVNIVHHAKKWKDLLLEISGPIARKLEKTFSRTYHLAGGSKKLTSSKRKKGRQYKIRSWIIEHTPIAGHKKLKQYYLKKIQGAKHSLFFVTPYFIPRKWLEEALQEAAKRGVEINIIIPKNGDLRLLNIINLYYVNRISKYGIKTYLSPHMNHAKAILIDEKEAMIGSGNLDSQSFEFNNEIGIFSREKAIVKKLSEILYHWKDEAELYKEQTMQIHWLYKVLGVIWKLLNPIL